MASTLIAGATIPGIGVRDVRCRGGRVTEVGSLTGLPGEERHDLAGYLLLPALAEPHVHLDKIFSCSGGDSGDAGPVSGLRDAIERHEAATPDRDAARTDPGLRSRASAALLRYVAHGTTALRCHVSCGRDCDTATLATLVDLRDRMRSLIDVQIVADLGFVQGRPWSELDVYLRSALESGADLVGGYPSLEADPAAALDTCLAAARDYGRGVDLHLDEAMNPRVLLVRELARRVRSDPLAGTMTASHCVGLGSCEPAAKRAVSAEIADAHIGVVTNPMTNLYLQDRPAGRMRGLTAIGELVAAGVVVAAGSDNVQDAFNPMGRCDPLEIASLLVTAGQREVPAAFDMVAGAARTVMGLPPAGPGVGAVADILAIRADSLSAAIAAAPADRMVFTAGRLVARSRTDTWISAER